MTITAGCSSRETQWSWRQVVAESERRGQLLLDLRTDGPFHVGVLLENTPEYLFLLAGAALVGAVIVGINPTRRGAELASDITKTDCQLLITDSTQQALVDHLDLGIDPSRVLVADGADYRGALDDLGRPERPGVTPDPPDPSDLYLLIFTSGSTGGPKAVRMTQGRAARAATGMGFTSEDVIYSAMPLFHGNALSAAVFPALASGATLALRRRFSASGFLGDIRAVGATYFNTVGRAISHIVATPPTEHDRDHRLRFVLGPETSAPDKAEFTRRFGVPVFEGYGSSEGAIVLQPVPDGRPGTLGRARDDDDVAVVDSVTGLERPRAVFDAERSVDQPGRGHRRGRRAVRPLPVRGLLQQCRSRGRAHPQRLVLVRRSRLPRRSRGSSTSPVAAAIGSGWTVRISPPLRSNGSWPGSRGCSGWRCSPFPTAAPATR